MRRATMMTVLVVLLTGCYALMKEQVSQAFVGADEALKRNDPKTAAVCVATGREVVGEPKRPDEVPRSYEQAVYWRKRVLARARAFAGYFAGVLGMLGLPGCLGIGGTLSLAGIAAWLLKNRARLVRMGGNLSALALSKGATLDDVKGIQEKEAQRPAMKKDFAARGDELKRRGDNGGH